MMSKVIHCVGQRRGKSDDYYIIFIICFTFIHILYIYLGGCVCGGGALVFHRFGTNGRLVYTDYTYARHQQFAKLKDSANLY